MSTGAGGGGCGQLSAGCGQAVADAFVGPNDGQDQDDGFVQAAAPSVAVGVRGASGAAVAGADLAELGEGDGVAAGFGEEVARRRPKAASGEPRIE